MDKNKEIKIKQDKEKIAQDEKIYASLAYVAPFQIFVYFVAKTTNIYTDFVKKHMQNSIILYLLLAILTTITFFVRSLTVPENLWNILAVMLLIFFIISIALIFIIFIKAMIIFKE